MIREGLKILTILVLLLIHRYKPHGYMLMKEIQSLSQGMLRPGPSRIYPLLFLLKQRGLIREIEGGGRRKRYDLTEKGVELLREELPKFREVISSILKIVVEEMEKLGHKDVKSFSTS